MFANLMLLPLNSQSTIDKIKFLKHGKNSAIQTTIDLRYIPRAYGGESNLEITAEQAKEFTAETIHYGWVGPDMVPLINDIEDITP
ncbi:hypothetical protein SARC_14700 [Sphaeroforma arctica JP610]|uniref:Uncharacterized protein n=1 Tax=Sphaeroforma arctica JP610 TaxID=667725 RepID=A0A0L0F7M8_9EUKA|nr:hypothetical protein SARC_14700 [Sphaeroforma arctica JP610]KNC72742.1 hypothetical protein SARC_14700 [Sphaeroforma arctica JP610]|eukprot:XP_014146644.1 hypothetical protein SARC_14700 [Sphaeroforma arctica JP610]